MRLKKTRTCNGCKALNEDKDRCDLNFEIVYDYDKYFKINKNHRPLEKCFKPTTNIDWCNAHSFWLKSLQK